MNEAIITSKIDTDHYKLTMGRFLWEKQPTRTALFQFTNRTCYDLSEYVDVVELREQFKALSKLSCTDAEARFLCSQDTLTSAFVDSLNSGCLRGQNIDDDFNIQFEDIWPRATMWEVPALAIINELYFKGWMEAHGISKQQAWAEGEKRLREKAALLQDYPELKFIDFGTRRRFSGEWHSHVVEMCLDLMPNNIVGTSNELMAMEYDLPAIGTMAHECPMGYSRLFGNSDQAILDSHHIFLQDWWEVYGSSLSIALTDTFGSKSFFDNFTPEQAENWRGLRQDSGNPVIFAMEAKEFYEDMGIKTQDKVIVFSDGLTFPKMVEIWDLFHDTFQIMFGIGTNLTNDVGVDPLSMVIKLFAINGLGTVKLSDNSHKTMGSPHNVENFKRVFDYKNNFTQSSACVY